MAPPKSNDTPQLLENLRHTTAHVMAQAVLELFPEAKLGTGPATENGFYYDFDLPRALTPDDLPIIKERMRRIIADGRPLECRVVSVEEARRLFAGQPYKREILDELEQRGAAVSVYEQNGFEDLCGRPHLQRTGEIDPDAFNLLTISGAYWRGNEHRPMLQRIYGTAWRCKEELDHYLWQLEEAKKRDHRVLGRELDLFSTSEEVGPGLILWHPKGATIRMLTEDYVRCALTAHGYEWVVTPHIGRANLWETSGHLDFFRDEMYPPMELEGETYYAKPMNCPFHLQIYKSRLRSYRDLPVRYTEFGTVYRYERGGVLHGLTRVRGATIDDTHIFCRPDQVEDEIENALRLALSTLRAFGLTDLSAELSTRPEKAVGVEAQWERATDALRRAIESQAIPYRLDEGGGAFYGPKASIKLRDAIGREWQCSTVQFDFNLPERFGLEYIGDDNRPHQPYMVHHALLGSLERLLGVLIEHHAGALPIWLAPVQAVAIPVSPDRHGAYAGQVSEQLRLAGLRVSTDDGGDRMQAKIRRAQLEKIPYMLVVGDREVSSGAVTVRARNGENLGAMPTDTFIEHVRVETPIG